MALNALEFTKWTFVAFQIMGSELSRVENYCAAVDCRVFALYSEPIMKAYQVSRQLLDSRGDFIA